MFGHQAYFRFREAHIQIKRRGQCGGHAVAELVKEYECQNQQRRAPALAGDEFMKRLNHGFTQGFGCTLG